MSVFAWQEIIWEKLLGEKSSLPHALLLKGRRGTGKLAFARLLAQALLCEKPLAAGEACGECAACNWFVADSHPDFRQIEPLAEEEEGESDARSKKKKPATQIKIEQIRELGEFVHLSSHRSGAKVILIHPAEALNPNAANALLKTLEEPPPHTYFFLVAHAPQRLLPTVVSRCRQIAMPAPNVAQAAQWLRGQGVREPELSLAQADYAPLAAAGLDEEAYWSERETLLRGIASPRFDAVLLAESMQQSDPARVLNWLQKWLCDLIFFKFTGKIRYHLDCAPALREVAQSLDAAALLRFYRELTGRQRTIHHPLNARLTIEHLLLSYSRLAST